MSRVRARLGRAMLAMGLAAVLLVGCGPRWEATVQRPDGGDLAVTADWLASLDGASDDKASVAVERVLWRAGHTLVESLEITTADGASRVYDWPETAPQDAWWDAKGNVTIAGESVAPARLVVHPPASLVDVEASIIDIAPTAAAALALRMPTLAEGEVHTIKRAEHVLLLFLDGFGYVRYQESLAAGDIPNLAALGEPMLALTVYPPSTRVATAALLTGAPPDANGVTNTSLRNTEAETLFDVAAEEGLEVLAVEGYSLAFNLRNAEVELSGDRDGNGSTDDNVLANALAVLEADMPPLLYVHFHGIDDAGHTYGPGAPEEIATIREVDAAVGRLLDLVPPDTLVITFADHGMHAVQQEGRLGDHGHLIERDMLIPIWLTFR
ncbi:MAG: alkaline phosphatase family protein [Anaerolineae bacterium]